LLGDPVHDPVQELLHEEDVGGWKLRVTALSAMFALEELLALDEDAAPAPPALALTLVSSSCVMLIISLMRLFMALI